LRSEADHEPFLFHLVSTIAVDLELDVGDAVTKMDQSIPVLSAIQLRKYVHDLFGKKWAHVSKQASTATSNSFISGWPHGNVTYSHFVLLKLG
jgi:hypothetical protein